MNIYGDISEIIFLSDLIYLTVLYNLDFWVKKTTKENNNKYFVLFKLYWNVFSLIHGVAINVSDWILQTKLWLANLFPSS